ncbi:uncharacterized protein LOC125517090 [Triticum urartu]|nr:uncharacterized protein LOC125517090 [Triticum urartu]
MQKVSADDVISSLPDDILLNILDRLNVRDATRTSILSRRWSQLSAMLPRLSITAQDVLPSKSKTGTTNKKTTTKASISKDVLVRRTNAAVVKAARSILARRDLGGRSIRLFSATFYLRDDAPMSVGCAVGNAMATCKIDKTEFTILTEKERVKCTANDLVNYAAWFVSFFQECPHAFVGLTRLYLENLRFAESDFVSNIIITCKQLECLKFVNCSTKSWITLHVEHAQLSELSIVNCRFDMVKLTWLPKLTRLAFEYWMMSFQEPPLSIGYAPLLKALTLSNVYCTWHKTVEISKFLYETSIQDLRDLRLGFKYEKIWVQPERLTKRLTSVFQQLRIANLVDIPEGYDLTWTMFILEAAPSLEELYMKVMHHPCEMQMNPEIRREHLYSNNKGVEWKSPTSNFKHRRLTKFILFGFQVNDYMVNHVRRILKATVNLQDIYPYDRLICPKCPAKQRYAHVYNTRVCDTGMIRFPLTNEERRLVQQRMFRRIESLAVIHFLRADEIRDEHWPRIAGDSLRAREDS